MPKLQGNIVQLQGIVSDDGSTLLGFSDPNTTGDGVDFVLTAIGGGGGGFSQTPFSQVLDFSSNFEMPQTLVTGALAFTSTGTIVGSQTNLCLVSNGVNVPTFATNFKEATGSSGYDNRPNIKNYFQFIYSNNKVLYSIFQEIGDTGLADTIAPTLASAVVQNATPTIVAVTYSEALDQTVTQNIADWAVTGHTVSAVTFASATVINLTVNAFVQGEATRTVTYTNNANRVRDLFLNNALTSSATNITNNVASVPAQVTGLTAGSNTTTTQLLTFTAPANGGSAITDYVVQFSSDGGVTWSTFADGVSTATSISVTGLTSNTLYSYRVAAVNLIGQGAFSTVVSATTSASASVPAQVTGLTLGTPTDTTQPLTWTAPANGGSAITDYIEQYSTDGGTTWTTFTAAVNTTPAQTITGLTASTAYTYRVAAINAIGTGAYSTTVTGSTASPQFFVRFTTLGDWVESANGSGYNYTNSAYADSEELVGANRKIPASTNGFVQVKSSLATGSALLILNLNTNNTLTTFNGSGSVCGIFKEGSIYKITEGASGGVNINGTSVTAVANDLVRLERTGTTITAKVSKDNGATFTTVHTFGVVSTSDLFPSIQNVGTGTNAVVTLPEASSSSVLV